VVVVWEVGIGLFEEFTLLNLATFSYTVKPVSVESFFYCRCLFVVAVE